MTETETARVSFRDVLGMGEFRAVWLAQLASIAGDQFAKLAVAVLVYERTGSALLAAAAFAATVVPMFAGGLLLGWVADAFPRRTVMVVADGVCAALVAVMALPGMPLWGLLVLLGVVSLAFEPFLAARAATNREVLGAARFQVGIAITMSTYQVAQLAGFALGGVVAGVAGPRPALLIDAASFAVSALLIRIGVAQRPAPGGHGGRRIERPTIVAGWRVVFAHPAARVAMGLMWLAAFFAAPEGVSVPLAKTFGGGAATAGLLLAAMTAGAALGPLVWTRLVPEEPRMRWTGVSAVAASGVLVAFAVPPPLGWALAILAASGACTGYIASASGALFGAVPDEQRGTASGVVGAGMVGGQGLMLLVAGALAQAVSPALAVAACGAAGVAAGIPLALAWRKVRSGADAT
jgi:hypothetical protein